MPFNPKKNNNNDKEKPKTSKFKKQSYINIKLGTFTSPSCHVGRGNESETFILIFVIIYFSIMSHVLGSFTCKLIFVIFHFSIMSHVLGSHGNKSETCKKQLYINIKLGSFTSTSCHVGRGNELECVGNFPSFVMSHVLGSPN